MKFNFQNFCFYFVVLWLTLVLVSSHRLKKFKKHNSYNTLIESNNSLNSSDQEINQTHIKLLTQLYYNFNENEQISKIFTIFKDIKSDVQFEDDLLSNISMKVFNYNQLISENYFPLFNQKEEYNFSRININHNVTTFNKVKKNMTNLLKSLLNYSNSKKKLIFFYFK